MEDRASVAGFDPGESRQFVDDAGRDQQIARLFLGAVGERHAVLSLPLRASVTPTGRISMP